MVALDSGSSATAPLAGQVEVICALATYMTFADMLLENNQPRSKSERSRGSYVICLKDKWQQCLLCGVAMSAGGMGPR